MKVEIGVSANSTLFKVFRTYTLMKGGEERGSEFLGYQIDNSWISKDREKMIARFERENPDWVRPEPEEDEVKNDPEGVIEPVETTIEGEVVQTPIEDRKTLTEKPKMEDFGWQSANGFDEESGWMYEGGEERYFEALKKYEEE